MLRRAALAAALLVIACGGRRPEPARSHSPAETRRTPEQSIQQIVVIGDSLAAGQGDESKRGIPGWLDEELARRGIAARPTRNLGRNGATTSDLAARLQEAEVRRTLAEADAIVVSVGANDLVRTPGAREEAFRNPLGVAKTMLDRVAVVIRDIRALAPDARILILGGYNPVRDSPYGTMIDRYLILWDGALAERFGDDPRVDVVPLRDLLDDPSRLSSRDHFHPGEAAYRDIASRVAGMLVRSPESRGGE